MKVNNPLWDVTLKEDQLRTKLNPLTRIVAGLWTLAVKLLQQFKPRNTNALIELFQDDFGYLLHELKRIRFL